MGNYVIFLKIYMITKYINYINIKKYFFVIYIIKFSSNHIILTFWISIFQNCNNIWYDIFFILLSIKILNNIFINLINLNNNNYDIILESCNMGIIIIK